jgi:ribosomal protein S18 acetylase RimI-like enzyme
MVNSPATLNELFRVERRQAGRVGEMMARAFDGDELYAALFPAAKVRQAVLPPLMAFRVRYGTLYGEVYATSPALEGVAVWIRGDKSFMTPWRSFRAGGLSLYAKIGGAAWRIQAVERYVMALHRQYAPIPYWHLSPVAVDPAHQRKGLARRLLKAMFARLDAESVPCFLETQSPANVVLYERYGFAVVAEGTIPETDVRHWAMLRAPRPWRATRLE